MSSNKIVNHTMQRSYILDGVVNAEARPAWCGRVFVAKSMGGGRTDVPDAEYCADCEAVINAAKAHARARDELQRLRAILDELVDRAQDRQTRAEKRIREAVPA